MEALTMESVVAASFFSAIDKLPKLNSQESEREKRSSGSNHQLAGGHT